MLDILSTLTVESARTAVPERRRFSLRLRAAIGAGAVLGAAGLAVGSLVVYNRAAEHLDRELSAEAAEQAAVFASNVQRTAATTLLTAQDPIFQEFYRPGNDRTAIIAAGGPIVARVHTVLNFLEVAYPDRVGEVCFIDIGGAENARVVKGAAAPAALLSSDETTSSFFGPTVGLRPGEVYRSRPYLSPDTGEWVVSHSTPIANADGTVQSMFHAELTIEGLRADWAARPDHRQLYAIDARTGAVVVNTEFPQEVGADLGQAEDQSLIRVTVDGADSGAMTIGDRRVAYRRLDGGRPGDRDWYLVVSADSVGLWAGRSLVVKISTVVLLALLTGLIAWSARVLMRRRELNERQRAAGRLA